MNGFEIIAKGVSLDTYEDFAISLNYQIDDILKIDKRNTNFSKTITIPGTSKNNQFFKQIFDVNVNNINFNPNIKIPASIRVGNNTVMNGNLQLLNIVVNNEEVNYEVAVFGELKNILNEFGDYTLKNLDFSEYNHTRNKTNIQNSWSYVNVVNGADENLVNKGEGYIYPYIVNGNSSDIYDSVYIYDLFPSFYLKTYIDKMFEFSGFTYTSNFFDSSYFKKLIIPFIGDKIQMPQEVVDERKSVIGINGTEGDLSAFKPLTGAAGVGSGWIYNSIIGHYLGLDRESGTVDDGGQEVEFRDDLGQWDGSIFECSEPGRYDIDFTGKLLPKITNTDGIGSSITYQDGTSEYVYRLQLVKTDGTVIELDSSRDLDDPSNPDGIQEFDLSDSIAHTSPWYDIDTEIFFSVTAENVFLETGDKVRIFFGSNIRSDMDFAGNDSKIRIELVFKESLDGNFTKMDIRPSSNASYGNEDLELNTLLSDKIKMKDLFLDVVKMFNLIISDNPNKPNDLIIEPRDDYFKSKQKVKDWTYLLDRDSDIKITPMSELDAKTYLYKYSNDSDLYNKEYLDETKKTYGELSVSVINDFSEKVNKTSLMFAPTPDSNYQISGRVAPFFVEKSDENIKAKKVKPRILFYNGLVDIPDGSLKLKEFINDPSATDLDGYPYCGMWDHPYTPSEDLGFGATDKIYWNPQAYPVSNLYEKFHKATLNNIIDINSRLFEASFKLTPKEIADFDFRDIIFIDGSYWRVNKIKDYNPVGSDKLTKVILYKIIDLNVINQFTVELPVSNVSCPVDLFVVTGLRNPYYASVSGQEITEDCCNSMGGDYTDGVCYVGPVSTDPMYEDQPMLQGSNSAPSQEPYGTIEANRDGSTVNSNGIKSYGKENFVPEGIDSAVIIGDKNSITKNSDKVLIVGDGTTADKGSGVYVGDTFIGSDGVSVGAYIEELETTDASIIDAMTIPIDEGNCVIIEVNTVGLRDDSKFGHSSVISATYRNDAGTINEVGVTTEKEKTDFSTANVDITISGTNVIVTVQGEVSNTIRWVLNRSITLVDVSTPLIE